MRGQKYSSLNHAGKVGGWASFHPLWAEELALHSSKTADPLRGPATAAAPVSCDEAARASHNNSAVVKEKQGYSGRGLEQRQAGDGPRDEPTVGQAGIQRGPDTNRA